MAITKLIVSRVEAYKNLKTSEDREIFTQITEELKKLSKMNIDQKRSYLTDSSSFIYQHRLVPAQLVKVATDIVDTASDIVTRLGENDDFTLNQSYNRNAGYYDTRRVRIIRKLIDVLLILDKNIAKYNEAIYYKLFGPCSEYDYQNITYLPKDELVAICGEHSNTDYKVVLDALRITGYIKTPVNKWFFTPDEVNEDGTRIHKRSGYAKPIWVSTDKLEALHKATDDKMTYITAGDSYENKIEQLKNSNDEVLGAIATILCIIPSDSIYLGAKQRLSKPAKLVRVKEGYEYTNEERKAGKLVKYEIIDSIRIKIVDNAHRTQGLDFAYAPSMSIKNMAESNIYELLKFSVDDYSGRLHTILTRLKREFKSHLVFINGSRIADIDIRACQPTILCAVLAQKGFPELQELVNNRDFYVVFHKIMKEENFLSEEGSTMYLSESDRDKVKKNCMQILFSNGAKYNKFVNRVGSQIDMLKSPEKGAEFRELMWKMGDGSHPYNKTDGMNIPDKSVIDYKTGEIVKKPVSTIPKRMQSLEVNIMFGKDGVLNTLSNSNINLATTIHDAVLVEEQHGNLTKYSMERIFNEHLNVGGRSFNSAVAKMSILTAKDEDGNELSLTW